jgi:hypothetical protein
MTDPRYETAQQHAAVLRARAEELSTAIYEAGKMGYRVSICLRNVTLVDEQDDRYSFLGAKGTGIDATISFDIGRAVL